MRNQEKMRGESWRCAKATVEEARGEKGGELGSGGEPQGTAAKATRRLREAQKRNGEQLSERVTFRLSARVRMSEIARVLL